MMTDNHYISSIREDAYRLLAACYYPPTVELLAENCCASLAALLANTVPEAARFAHEAAQAMGADLTPLQVEHARLFIGPFNLVAPPYGSIYLDDAKNVMGESTARVATFYQSCGLKLADDFHELPDHIAVELEFMSYLAHKQSEATTAGDRDGASRLTGLQRQFQSLFLIPWLEPFTSAIIEDGESPFYRAIARCTASFVNADYAALIRADNA